MATALSAQLAQIRSQSNNPLDLKAQKRAHSQSLLYDPQVAGSQDFDTIYQLCYDGFEDLCRLDSKFLRFGETIFSEQSKSQDRTQMTSAQNKELDAVLEDFLSLISRRLALKPALKAIEWIIRRFRWVKRAVFPEVCLSRLLADLKCCRVHENNTLILVLTFIPYHETSMFTTLLSLLPKRLPQQIKFLHPYTESLANPSRHTIVYSISNSKPLFAALSHFVLKCCRDDNQFPALVSFWASTIAEAIVTMLEQSRSARLEAQIQNEEDTLIFILPILSDALAISALDLRVGCYMILFLLASKTRLDEKVLTIMMEAVVSNWHAETRAGVVCLAMLAEQQTKPKLPRKVIKALLSLPSLIQVLNALHGQYQINNLVLGIVLGILKSTEKSAEVERFTQVEDLFKASLIDEVSSTKAIGSLLSMIAKSHTTVQNSSDFRGHLCDLVFRLAKSHEVGHRVQTAVHESKLELGQLRPTVESLTEGSETKTPALQLEENMDIDQQDNTTDIDAISEQILTKSTAEISFLTPSKSDLFNNLEDSFCAMPLDFGNLVRFSDMPVLRRSLAKKEPLFLSFYIRIWCSNNSGRVRAAALKSVTIIMKDQPLLCDMQVLFPYLIHAFSDPLASVRRAAAEVVQCLILTSLSGADGLEAHLNDSRIYGSKVHPNGISWLSPKISRQFLETLLAAHMQECALDQHAILNVVPTVLNGNQSDRESGDLRVELKKSSRLSILTFLCDHVVNSPLYNFKLRMLRTLNKVEKISSVPRTKMLLPLLYEVRDAGLERLKKTCEIEKITIVDLITEVTNTVTPISEEGILALKHIGESDVFEVLQSAAFQRLKTIWPKIKAEMQLSLADALLNLALSRNSGSSAVLQQAEATGVLHSVQLSATVLQHLLNGLPLLASQTEEPSAKRRRIENGNSEDDTILTNQNLEHNIRKITFVLELVDASKAGQHVSLTQRLFHILSDLKNAQDQASTALGYLQVLTMDCLLSILAKSKTSKDMSIDAAIIPVDILIDYIRTTPSPQIRSAALLLVASLSDITPERVLHSIMPIFMYMGANILRQEDEFSVYVVQQTMDSVIPRLVHSLHRDARKAFVGVAELLASFAAAFEHIPQQRRLGIFVALVNKVGNEDYLFALCAILADRYPGNKKALQLSLDMITRNSLQTQLKTIERYLQVMLDVWGNKKTRKFSTLLLDQAGSAETATFNLIPLTIAAFGSESVKIGIRKTLKNQAAEVEATRTSIAAILELIFVLSQHCRDNSRLHSSCMKLMDSFLQILPSSELVQTLEGLLDQVSEELQKRVLGSFVHHLSIQKTDDKASREACLAFVPRLLSSIQEGTDPLLKRAAVSAIDQIAEKYGKVDSMTVINAAKVIADDTCLDDEDMSLRAASLLCLSTMVEVSGEAIVPIVPFALPKVFKNLEISIEKETRDANVHNACYSVALALLIYIPWILAGADLDHLLTASHKSANAELGDDCEETRTEALQTIAGQIGAKELLAALVRTWPSAMTAGPQAVLEHLQILHLTIEKQPKSILMQQTETLGEIFLQAFSLRTTQSPTTATNPETSYSEANITAAESLTTRTAIAMISKLNDTTFRPLFQRFHTWSTTTPPSTSTSSSTQAPLLDRQLTWYTFLPHFFAHFKSIVTSYTALILPDLLLLLQTLNPSSSPTALTLWQNALKTILTTCDHDQDSKLPPCPSSIPSPPLTNLNQTSTPSPKTSLP